MNLWLLGIFSCPPSLVALGFGDELWRGPAEALRAKAGELGVPRLLALGTPAQGAPSPWLQFIPFLLVLAIFYFVILMPMKKRQQKVQAFLSALKVSDRVITSGGIYGTITKLNDQSVQLQVANNVRIEVSRAAIVGYQGQEPVAEGITQGNQS